MIYTFFDKKFSCGPIISNQQLAQELKKPFIRKYEKRKVHSPFKDNIWGADLADMQLIDIIKEFVSHYRLLIFLVNMHGISRIILVYRAPGYN